MDTSIPSVAKIRGEQPEKNLRSSESEAAWKAFHGNSLMFWVPTSTMNYFQFKKFKEFDISFPDMSQSKSTESRLTSGKEGVHLVYIK